MYREPVRASHSHLVNASGVRWWSLRRRVPMPWAQRVWAWPCLTGLAPSARDHQERGQRHQQRTDGARPRLLRVRRGAPERSLVRVTESRVAVMTWWWRLRRLAQPLCRSTR
jgi:hypothetical protein